MLSLVNSRPFAPFRFIMSDGGTVDVPSREMVFPLRNCAIVGILKPGETETIADLWTTVWYMHVTRIEMTKPGSAPFTAFPPTGSESPYPVA
jgi:hypothetical protein